MSYFDRIDDQYEELDKDFARAFALYSLGRQQEFDATLRKRLSDYPKESAEGIARLYAWSGQANEAFVWLEKMVEDEGPESVLLVKTELYEPIKSDPRWEAFLEKHGAADRDFFNVRFNPQYPPTLQRAVDKLDD